MHLRKHLIILSIIFLSIPLVGFSQIKSTTIGIDGFTCSMCAYSVEKALMKLDFVKMVKMDINNKIAEVYFKENKEVNIFSLADKVMDAGFSVRSISSVIDFDDISIHDNDLYTVGNYKFCFLETGERKLIGPTTIKFLNKKLISKKDYPYWQSLIFENSKGNGNPKDLYYVTL